MVGGGNGNDASLFSYLGKGNGRFDPAEGNLADAVIYGLGLAKMDKGGKWDAVAVTGIGRVLVMLGRKNGKFFPWYVPQISNTEVAWDALAMGDFNDDREQDAVVAYVNKFVLLRGKGDGTFKAPKNFPAAGAGVDGIEAADFNEDGDLDVAIANASGISVAVGDGDGHFSALAPYGGGLAAPVFLGSGRLNSDEGLDLVRGAEAGYDITSTSTTEGPRAARFQSRMLSMGAAGFEPATSRV